MEALEAAVFIHGGSLQELVRPVIEQLAHDVVVHDEEIATAVGARRRARAAKAADAAQNVTDIRAPKRRTLQ
jgi:hypothetical protein